MLNKILFYVILIAIGQFNVCHSNEMTKSKPKKALITGVTGQDGSYLAEILLEKGYEVHGIKRRSSSLNTQRIDHIYRDQHEKGWEKFVLHYADLTDANNISRLIREIEPDEVYNLAAQSHVAVSFELPEYTLQATAAGVLNVLEAIRIAGFANKTKFYQASSSEMYGQVQEIPQTEKTPFHPRSPYGVAKVCAFWMTVNYREAYNMFACNGILFNHESPRRGETFVTRKITRAVANIKYGLQDTLYLGNLDSQRDWGYARDYAEAMWLMLQQEKPDDYVIAMNETHSVREFVELAFKEVGINIVWQGKGLDEIGLDRDTGKVVVAVDKRYFRPSEVDLLLGDSTKARKMLNWTPRTSLQDLVKIMVEADCKEIFIKRKSRL